ncbi:MAG: TrmO family methyltransferase [Desulfomonile sp.]
MRPNQIGLSIVRLTGVSENILDIEDVDIVDGTPLLDIKPLQKECLLACRLFLRERRWTHD